MGSIQFQVASPHEEDRTIVKSDLMHEIVLILRVFPGMSKPNPFNFLNKLDLFRECLDSLAISVGQREVRIEVLLDSCSVDYENAFRVFPSTADVKIHRFEKLGNVGSFEKQLEIACGLEDSTIVLLIEDDYYWSPDGFGILIDLIKQTEAPCFATPYNHPDYLNLPIHQEGLGPSSEWRSGLATTCTFIARAGTIKSRKRILNKYSILNDFGMWLCLTRTGLKPSRQLLDRKSKQHELGVLRDWIKAWLVFILFSLWRVPVTQLFYPLVSGATHMDSNYLGHGRKWPF